MKNQLASALILPALLLAIGITAAGYFISRIHYNAKIAINTAEAKGLAERRVPADRANWSIGHSVTGASRDDWYCITCSMANRCAMGCSSEQRA